MGKTSKFFKALFGFKASDDATHQTPSRSDHNKQPKRRWSFIKSNRDKLNHHLPNTFDPSLTLPRYTPLHHQSSVKTTGCNETTGSINHAIPVAAANVEVAEYTVAAPHAATEVVRMTSRTTAGSGLHVEWAAIKIQSYFRGYLSRKALRALKALVKLQALVRGHILRKQAAVDFRRLQALLRVQARARAGRFQISDSPQSTAKGPATPEKFENSVRARTIKHDQPSILKNNGYTSYSRYDNERILEMDTVKHHLLPSRRRSLFHSQSLTNSGGSTIHQPGFSPSGSCEVNSITTPFEEEVSFCIPQNSPPIYSVSSKAPFTPAKSDSSRSCVSGYSDHPNYMAYTESSRAKVRSVSAPRQRGQVEFSGGMKRYSVYGYGLNPGPQRVSNLRDSFVSKAYPGSGRLDRLGMPVGGLGFRDSEISGGYWNYQ
ncbi:hypothetical protein L1887_00415 [Cichorium endivia]|nr:hypothetical protein L1887_00415 [Cichorium endivia]